MATLQNQFAQTVLTYLLKEYGLVTTETTMPVPEPQRTDVVFIPDRTTPHPDALPLGDLGRMLTSTVMLEPFSDAPSEDDFCALVRKVLTARHTAKKKATPAPFVALGDAVMWVLCAERPRQAMESAGFTPLAGWGAGYYTTIPLLSMRLVVLGELPDTEDTVLLRLLGTEAAQRRVVPALKSLAARDPRFAELLKMLVEYVLKRTSNDDRRDAMWDLRQAEQWIQEHVDRGVQRGVQQGRLEAMVHQFERRLQRPLGDAERTTLQDRLVTLGADRVGDVVLDATRDELARWLADPTAH